MLLSKVQLTTDGPEFDWLSMAPPDCVATLAVNVQSVTVGLLFPSLRSAAPAPLVVLAVNVQLVRSGLHLSPTLIARTLELAGE